MTQPYTAISLFSGAVDGLAIAAQAAGIKVTHHVEWDSWCCRVLRMNHPGSIVINEDIHNVRNLPTTDIIFGGSPCQDFSNAGSGAGFEGERYLWPEMFRIVKESRPRVIIHENVRGGISKGLLDKICDDLESEGYETKALVFPACVFGAPHERYRMFHIGLLADAESRRGQTSWQSTNQTGSTTSHLPSSQLLEHSQSPRFHQPQQADGWTHSTQDCRGMDDRFERSGRDVEHAKNDRLEAYDYESIGGEQRFNHKRFDGARNRNRLSQPAMGMSFDGLASRILRLDPLRDFPGFPAGQGSYQHSYEPPRTTPKKGKYAKEQIQALGNAVVWQQAAPIFRAVMRWLEGQDAS